MAYTSGKRIPIGFPAEIEEKVQLVAAQYQNSFAGAALWIISDWLRQNEATLQEWRDKMPDSTGPLDGVSIVADAVLKGKKVMVRLQPGGKLVPLQEYLEARKSGEKKDKRSEYPQ